MVPLLTDAQFQSLALVLIAAIGIVPATLAAVWSRTAKSNSAEAKVSSAKALDEVSTNGGMTSEQPNINDHIKYQTELSEKTLEALTDLDGRFTTHLEHSQIMDRALAEVYLKVKPGMTLNFEEN